MKCQCMLVKRAGQAGECAHKKVNACTMKAKKLFTAPGQRLQLCNGCAKQYNVRWRPGGIHAA